MLKPRNQGWASFLFLIFNEPNLNL